MASPIDELLNFLDTLWGTTESLVYTPRIEPDGEWKIAFHQWPANRLSTAEWLLAKSAEGCEVYVAPATFTRRKVEKSAIKESRVLWTDFDGNAPEIWPEDATVPEPSLKIQTSTGRNVHMYWVLEDPITDVQVLENKNRTLAYDLKADLSGWDATQVLRPPHTTNYGTHKPERQGRSYPVSIEYQSSNRYSVELFSETKDFRSSMADWLSGRTIPSVRSTLAKLVLSDSFMEKFDQVPENIETGTRSDLMMEVTYLAAEAGATDEQLYALVFDMDERWGKYKKRSDRIKRLVDFVERARTKVPIGLLGVDSLMAVEVDKKLVYNIDEFLNLNIKIDWVYKDLFAVETIGMFAAAPGVGKTTLTTRMALQVAKGENFLGKFSPVTNQNRRCMYLSMEMGETTYHNLLSKYDLSKEERQKLRDYLFVVPLGEHLPLRHEQSRKFLESLLETYKPEVLFFDSWSRLVSGDMSSDETVLEVHKYLQYLRKKYHTAMMVVHHDKKRTVGRGKAVDLDDVYGSRFTTSEVDFVFTLHNDNGLWLSNPKTRLGPQFETIPLIRSDNNDFFEGSPDDSYIDLTGSRSSFFGKSANLFTGASRGNRHGDNRA